MGWVIGEKEHSSQGNRGIKGTHFEWEWEHWGKRNIRGTREQVPSSLPPERASLIVCKELIIA